MKTEKTHLESIELETSQPIIGSVIWLHGLGADGSDFVPIVPELKLPSTLGLRFIFPHAPVIPVTINRHFPMRAWYDITSLEINQRPDFERIEQSTHQVIQLIEKEVARGIPREKILLAGFSQGAVIALATGLYYQKPLAGIIALSGYLVLSSEQVKKARRLPIFIAHGREDNVVPYGLSEIAFNTLQDADFPVVFKSYLLGHGVCGEEILDLSQWIRLRFE